MNVRAAWLVTAFAMALMFMGVLRLASVEPSVLSPFSRFATVGYILATVLFSISLTRTGVPFNRLGFGTRLNVRHVGLAIAAFLVFRVVSMYVSPLIEDLVGSDRNLERFEDVRGSTSSLASLLLFSWTFAAFGKELAYRIVLMRGIAYALGDRRAAPMIALVAQAMVFGVAHLYQGLAGVVGSMISGLVFGAVTLIARGSIWPAALAHGANNTVGILSLYE